MNNELMHRLHRINLFHLVIVCLYIWFYVPAIFCEGLTGGLSEYLHTPAILCEGLTDGVSEYFILFHSKD